MKAIKAILSGKGVSRKGEKGFTLVELLIVLAILAVLAAVVIPNVTGMLGRGALQAYSTDLKTMQTGVSAFYFDIHKGVGTTNGTWGEADAIDGHYLPTVDGLDPNFSIDTAIPYYLKGNVVYAVLDAAGDPVALADDIAPAAIWMGLLVNSPEDAECAADDPGAAHTQGTELGPYLNEFPQSSSHDYNGNPADPGGTYTWIIVSRGNVAGAGWVTPYTDQAETTAGDQGWYARFNGTYP